MDLANLSIFALNATAAFGQQVSARLGVPLSAHEEREFEDGEHKARPLVGIRGRDVFVLQSLHGDDEQSGDEKLCRLLFFLGAVRDAGADRVTAVIPYLAYARKDRRTKPRDPVTIRYVATLLEAIGTDQVVVLDVHNSAAFDNAFRRPAVNLEARKLFARHFADRLPGEEICAMSPDIGGVKRVNRFQEALQAESGRPIATAFMEKYRSAGVVSGEKVMGEVEGKAVIIFDDLISTGTTMLRAAKACRSLGARRVCAAASHGLFTGDASAVVTDPLFDEVAVTSAVPPFRLTQAARERLSVVDVAPLFAEAIQRLHTGGSIVDLLE